MKQALDLRVASSVLTDRTIIGYLREAQPLTDVLTSRKSDDWYLKTYIPNARRLVISDLRRAPRKWVLFVEGVPVQTGTWDPSTYKGTVDAEIDSESVRFVM